MDTYFYKNVNMKLGGKIKKLPISPGVYKFYDRNRKLLYIGRATNLRDRVKSYFTASSGDFRPIEAMKSEISRLEVVPTETVLEAVILEAALVQKFQPSYNVKLKDDKSFLGIYITEEGVPRVFLARLTKKGLPRGSFYGVYTSFKIGQATLRALRRIFPFCSGAIPARGRLKKERPCFYFHLGLCSGICVGATSTIEYRKMIQNLKLFLSGKKKSVIRSLKQQMKRFADVGQFEKAASLRDQLRALENVQDIALQFNSDPSPIHHPLAPSMRIEGYDISHISGSNAVGAMIVWENGKAKKSEYRKFKISAQGGSASGGKTLSTRDDVAMLKEVVCRRLKHNEWPLPQYIVVDGGVGQVNAIRSVTTIPVIGIAKGPKRKKNDIYISREDKKQLGQQWFALQKLLPEIRDEAHRFAISYHRSLYRLPK